LSAKSTIYIIDDDEAVRSSVGFMLTAFGFSVLEFTDARRFLDEFSEDRAACVICDIRMPGIDGLELARTIRLRHSSAPILLITGHADAALFKQAAEAGADHVLEKPVDTAVLMEVLAQRGISPKG
jgi:two-component system response regulator FixJ